MSIQKIRDRHTGKEYEGPWELSDDYPDADIACPTCGAEPTACCSVPDGGEISRYIHAERAEAWENAAS